MSIKWNSTCFLIKRGLFGKKKKKSCFPQPFVSSIYHQSYVCLDSGFLLSIFLHSCSYLFTKGCFMVYNAHMHVKILICRLCGTRYNRVTAQVCCQEQLESSFRVPLYLLYYDMYQTGSLYTYMPAILTNWDQLVIFMVFDPGNLTIGVK